MLIKNIKIEFLEPNNGQIEGLPENPRYITDDEFAKLVKSIKDFPEMLELRELIVYPYNHRYVVIAGNMRLRALSALEHKEVRCKVLDVDTSIDRLQAYTMKDNIAFGRFDFELLANSWDAELLVEWGMNLPVDFGDIEEPPKIIDPQPTTFGISIETQSQDVFETIKAELDRLKIGYNEFEK